MHRKEKSICEKYKIEHGFVLYIADHEGLHIDWSKRQKVFLSPSIDDELRKKAA